MERLHINEDKKIEFYSEVMISEDFPGDHRGKLGVIIGISEEDEILYGYSVLLHGEGYAIYLDKQYAIPTGKSFSREDFY